MPDGERVTTESEPRRWTLQSTLRRGWVVIQPTPPDGNPGDTVIVQEVVEPGHDEQTKDPETANGPWLLKFCPACGQRNDDADKCTNERAHPGRQPWLVREPVVLESRLREAESESEKRQVLIDVCCKNHDRQVERAHVAEARIERLEAELREARGHG